MEHRSTSLFQNAYESVRTLNNCWFIGFLFNGDENICKTSSYFMLFFVAVFCCCFGFGLHLQIILTGDLYLLCDFINFLSPNQHPQLQQLRIKRKTKRKQNNNQNINDHIKTTKAQKATCYYINCYTHTPQFPLEQWGDV